MAAKTRREQIEEMLAAEPHDPFLRYGLAMEYVSAGDDEGAAQRFRELFEIAPDYVPAYLIAAQTLVRLGRADEARAILQRGSDVARRQGDQHACEEMQGLLTTLS